MNRVSRFISMLLAAILLCLCTAGALAEAMPGLLEVRMVQELTAAYDRNPPTGAELDREAADALGRAMYGWLDPEKAAELFPGGPEETAALIREVDRSLRADRPCTDTGLYNAAFFYTLVWEILHWDVPAENKGRAAVIPQMKAAFYSVPEAVIGRTADKCAEAIGQYEPELTAGWDTGDAEWPGKAEYYDAMAGKMYEDGNYAGAASMWEELLKIRGKDPKTIFRIADAYAAMQEYNRAKLTIMSSYRLLETDADQAGWMRAWGNVCAGEGDWQLAYAWYAYSLTFEENEGAREKMAEIMAAAPETREMTAEEAGEYVAEHWK